MRILRVLTFLTAATVKNRVRAQLGRLKRPRYIFATAFALLYLWFFFGRRVEFGEGPLTLQGEARVLVVGAASAVWFLVLWSMWAFGRKRPALAFTEPEIQLLFPAPVSRRALLLYKMGRSLLLVLFTALVMTVLFGARLSGSFAFFLAGAWAGLGLHALHEMTAQLGRGSLVMRKARGWAVLVGALAAALVGMAFTVWWSAPGPLPEGGPSEWAAWARGALEGPLGALLFLPSAPVELALAPDLGHFLRWLPVSLGLGALHVFWILRSDVAFEEASVEEAEKRAKVMEVRRGGRKPAAERPRRSSMLPAKGRPEWALAWKNVLAARRVVAPRLWPLALPLVAMLALFGVVLAKDGAPGGIATGLAVALAGAAGLVALMGPAILRSDFRSDHAHMDLLRAMPLSGAQVVVGELAGAWALLALLQWGLLLVSAAFAVGAAQVARAPEVGVTALAGAVAAVVVLPCVTLMQLLVQNAAVLLLPGWADTGVERARGLEAFGQRLLLFVGSVLVMGVAFLPAGLLAAVVGGFGWFVMGALALPLAGLAAAAVLVAEALVAVWALGRVFDGYDVSAE